MEPILSSLSRNGQLAPIESVLQAYAWSPEAIRAHKDAELAKAPKPSLLYRAWTWKNAGRNVIGFTMVVSFFLMLVSFTAGVVLAFVGHVFKVPWAFTGGAGAACMFIGCIVLFGLCIAIGNIRMTGRAQWTQYEYSNFAARHPIPTEAAELARFVLEHPKNEGFRLTIQSLEQGTVLLDPILCAYRWDAILGLVEYAICVWDKDGTVLNPT